MSSYIYIPNYTYQDYTSSSESSKGITFSTAFSFSNVDVFQGSETSAVSYYKSNYTIYDPYYSSLTAIDLDDWGNCTFNVYINGSETDYDVSSVSGSAGDTVTVEMIPPDDSYYFPAWICNLMSSMNYISYSSSGTYSSVSVSSYRTSQYAIPLATVDSVLPTYGITPTDLCYHAGGLFGDQRCISYLCEDLFWENTQLKYLPYGLTDVNKLTSVEEELLMPLTNLLALGGFWGSDLASSYVTNTNMATEITFYIGSSIVANASNFAYARVKAYTLVYVPSGSTTYTTFNSAGSASTDTVANRRVTLYTY